MLNNYGLIEWQQWAHYLSDVCVSVRCCETKGTDLFRQTAHKIPGTAHSDLCLPSLLPIKIVRCSLEVKAKYRKWCRTNNLFACIQKYGGLRLRHGFFSHFFVVSKHILTIDGGKWDHFMVTTTKVEEKSAHWLEGPFFSLSDQTTITIVGVLLAQIYETKRQTGNVETSKK